MAFSMYPLSVPIYIRHLNGLATCLKKAQALYAERKYDESTLLGYRLYPDMFSFTRQVQIATDHARNGAALLAGLEAPKYGDNEGSLADLLARVERTVGYLKSIKPEQIDGSENRTVTVRSHDRDTHYTGLELVLNRSLPNFYFHTTIAYGILRHNGVDIGKKDFMGVS